VQDIAGWEQLVTKELTGNLITLIEKYEHQEAMELMRNEK